MNWREIMALGLGVLRLPPETFWSMSPREFSAALCGAFGLEGAARPLGAAEFHALAGRFPDEGGSS